MQIFATNAKKKIERGEMKEMVVRKVSLNGLHIVECNIVYRQPLISFTLLHRYWTIIGHILIVGMPSVSESLWYIFSKYEKQ